MPIASRSGKQRAVEVEASQTATRQELKVRAAKKVRLAQITPVGQVDLKPAVIKIPQQQSAQGDEQATEVLRSEGYSKTNLSSALRF